MALRNCPTRINPDRCYKIHSARFISANPLSPLYPFLGLLLTIALNINLHSQIALLSNLGHFFFLFITVKKQELVNHWHKHTLSHLLNFIASTNLLFSKMLVSFRLKRTSLKEVFKPIHNSIFNFSWSHLLQCILTTLMCSQGLLTSTASWQIPCAWLFIWICFYCPPCLWGEDGLSDLWAPPGTGESLLFWHCVDATAISMQCFQRSDLNHQQLCGTVHPVVAVLQMSGLQTWKLFSIRGSQE